MLDQILLFIAIGLGLVFFAIGRPRHDIVALLLLVFLVIVGIIPSTDAFNGFANPAVISVIAILIVSQGLRRSGLVDQIGLRMLKFSGPLSLRIFVMCALVVLISAFMNNVGALAIFMPIAIHNASRKNYPVSALLMPLAFASLLGGMTTLIGTPPNMIISAFRETALGQPFRFFSFAPVGAGLALIGILFIALLGWRLLPKRGTESGEKNGFTIDAYQFEVLVAEGGVLAGSTVLEAEALVNQRIKVLSMIRLDEPAELSGKGSGNGRLPPIKNGAGRFLAGLLDRERGSEKPDGKNQAGKKPSFLQRILGPARKTDSLLAPPPQTKIKTGDILILSGDLENVKDFVQASGSVMYGSVQNGSRDRPGDEQWELVEAVVAPDSLLTGKSAEAADLSLTYNLHLLAVMQRKIAPLMRIRKTVLQSGDVLLMQGRQKQLRQQLRAVGCLPLADRDVRLPGNDKLVPAVLIFISSVALVTAGLLPVQIAFALAAVAMVLFRVLPVQDLYSAVNWPVVVLLGALLPLGSALESTGASETLAGLFLSVQGGLPHWAVLGLIMLFTMLLSAFINNTATVVLMAPIAIQVAAGLQDSVDPFLMAVALGASCSFLTPVAHHSNTLVMGPGGYVFSDYVRLGLPLSLVTLLAGVPLIMFFWPL